MRNGKRIVSLLLIALLMLAILPASAHADPPAGTTHKHNWVVIQKLAPTCEGWGRTTWRCTVCGETYNKFAAPLGHDWDEGVVTKNATFFTSGVKTFTCKRDASHTNTETTPPILMLFQSMQDWTFPGTITTHDLKPLIITEQPQGGQITRYEDETHTMHVTASGGEGEYTYEWRTESQDFGKKEEYNDTLKWFLGLFGVTPEQVDEYLESSFSDTDTCTVSQAGQKYYCIVTDEAGQTATSESAPVEYKIRIAKQPDNVNLQSTEAPVLHCEAADGSGEYDYIWYDSKGEEVGYVNDVPVSEPGDYYCEVIDYITEDKVTSEMCTVYSAEPFHLEKITKDCELWPEESGMIVAAFSGGTPYYEIWWDKDGDAIDSIEGTVDDHLGSHVENAGIGKYTVHAVDAMGEVVTATCTISEKHLTIGKQPVGANLPKKDGWVALTTEIADGVAPYRVELYRNGTSYVGGESDSNTCTLTAWHSGLYNFYIEDSLGHSATSDYAYVGNAVFHIKKQTETGEISYPGGSAFLSVEAEGGLEPYTYLWSVRKDSNWYKTGDNSPYINAYTPGEYYCEVLDAEKDFVFSHTMTVTYTGAPWIIEQPQNEIVPNVPDEKFSAMLTCRAISGSGDDSTLKYNWEVKLESISNWAMLIDSGPSIHVGYTGTYRCRVTDTVTGKYTYSDAAIVCRPLVCTYAQPWKASNSRYYFYRCSFTGGIGPYKVTVYLINAEDPGHYPLLVEESRSVDTEDKLYLMRFMERKYVETWDTDPMQTYEIKVGCRVDVVDAIGQICSSSYMEWK